MNPQLLLVFSPFLALLYVLYALLQALRGQRQGVGAALLAFIAAAASLAAFVLTTETLARTRLEQLLLLNALIAFVASLLILWIERRRKNRDPNRSYGMIGIGLSILLALGIYVAPLLANAVPSSTETLSTGAANRPDTTFQTISALTPGAPDNQAGAAATAEAPAAGNDLAAVLSAQTGLTLTDLTAQLTAGRTLADLVSAHQGDVQAVTTAIKDALDALVASGGRGAQFLTRLGTDTATVADQIVQGQLAAQAQERILALLTGSESSTQGGAGSFAPPGGSASGTPAFNGQGNFVPPSDGTIPANGGGFPPPGAESSGTPAVSGQGNFAPPSGDNSDASGAASQPTSQPTSTPRPTLPPTATIQRPTRIVFPTATPTPNAAEATAQATSEAASSACALVTNYNLNLRNRPTTDGSTVLLSIPMGTRITADARSADNWYHVTYDDVSGWVSGDYASASADCASLPAQ